MVIDAPALLPIAVQLVQSGSFGIDLYFLPSSGSPQLYRAKDFPISSSDLQALKQRGIRTLYIAAEDVAEYERYLREQVLQNADSTNTDRFCALRDANQSMFMAALRDREVDSVVHVARDLAAQLSNVVCAEDQTVASLFQLLRHDYYTYTHVTNVCVYALLLAQQMGMDNAEELAQLATGALLHDLGKRHVDPLILNKSGRLSDSELMIIRRHPTHGFYDLRRRSEFNWEQLMMVYQHHERADGRGYPVGIPIDEIHPWARICSVVDVFDALTSQRPYRRPMGMTTAREYLKADAGAAFDAELVHCFDLAIAGEAVL